MKSHWTHAPLLLTAALLASCLLTAWMAVHGFYINTCLAALLTLGIAWAVCRYMKRTSRLMEQFVQSVRYSEFPEAFGSNHTGGHRGLPPELLDSMQEALEHYRTNLQRKEGRLLYFQALANHIDTAVLVYTPQGNIEWKNEAATRLLATAVNELQEETWILKAPKTVDDLRLFHPDLPQLLILKAPKTVDDLRLFHPDLPQLLRDLHPGSLHVIQVHRQEEGTQLALSGLEFILQGRKLIIASLKNIHSALDTQETLAWQKLIRVLTHEIMNSVTPIVSLAELLGKQVDGLEGNEQEKEDMRQMLSTIARRGNALTRFVGSYREVSHLPPPLLQPLDTTALLEDVVRFMQAEDNDLHLTPPPAPLRLLADKGQVEQVLINLIKNARENEARSITLSAGVTPTGRIFLRVTDNGTGIEPEVQERIFVPFFTTKPGGSGIGLTLARQIIHQHDGTIDVHSCPGEGSVFTLLFPYNH